MDSDESNKPRFPPVPGDSGYRELQSRPPDLVGEAYTRRTFDTDTAPLVVVPDDAEMRERIARIDRFALAKKIERRAWLARGFLALLMIVSAAVDFSWCMR